MTTSQILACAISWTAALGACIPLIQARRARRRAIPYTPPPRVHCGEIKPSFFETDRSTECVLPPGHPGSHADETGARWWLDPTLAPKEEPDA